MNWELLLKYLNKETDTIETRQVESWLNEQAEHRQVLDYLAKRKAQLNEPIKQTDIHDEWVRLLDKIFETNTGDNKSYPFKHWLVGVAASLLVLTLGVWAYLNYTTRDANAEITLQTPANRSGHATLADGTLVYMAPGTTITYTHSFNEQKRELHLTGEAFFNVKHDPAKAFIIRTDEISVSVLGTSFNVYAPKNKSAEVKVATGLVGIVSHNQTVLVKAGELFSYDETAHKPILANVEVKDAQALQSGSLFFNNDNAYAIAEKLHRWYNIRVEVMSSAAKHPRFKGEMKDTGLNNLMDGLSYATGLHYRFKDQNTLLLF